MIPLERFCAECDNGTDVIENPSGLNDGFIYATDRRVIIRVPGEFPNTPGFPKKAAELFREFESDLPWIDIPEVPPLVITQVRCLECGNSSQECVDNPVGMKIGNQIIAKPYLRLMKEFLPGVKIQLQPDPLAPVKIKFDGGIGLLMPMNSK